MVQPHDRSQESLLPCASWVSETNILLMEKKWEMLWRLVGRSSNMQYIYQIVQPIPSSLELEVRVVQCLSELSVLSTASTRSRCRCTISLNAQTTRALKTLAAYQGPPLMCYPKSWPLKTNQIHSSIRGRNKVAGSRDKGAIRFERKRDFIFL